MNTKIKIGFIITFILLYCGTMMVSLVHAFSFFELANTTVMSVVLASCFELGQAATLFTILLDKKKKFMPWLLMIILTSVQIMGNVFSSYKYMMNNHIDDLRYFTESIVSLFVTDASTQNQQVFVAYILGAILPIVALMLTAMVHNLLIDNKTTDPNNENGDIQDDKEENRIDIKDDSITTTITDSNDTDIKDDPEIMNMIVSDTDSDYSYTDSKSANINFTNNSTTANIEHKRPKTVKLK